MPAESAGLSSQAQNDTVPHTHQIRTFYFSFAQVIKLRTSKNRSALSLRKREPVCDISAMTCDAEAAPPSPPPHRAASRTSSAGSQDGGAGLLFGFQNRSAGKSMLFCVHTY